MASLRFTGKGAANYGVIQQENLMYLLENFADIEAPLYPTVGQEWYDTTNGVLKVCSSISPDIWKSIGGIQITDDEVPTSVTVGDMWLARTGTSSGILYIYTGLGRYPEAYPDIGGWNQIWPQIDTVAGREEYNYILDLVNQLAGPTSAGGNTSIGKLIPELPDLTILDTSLRAKFALTNDSSVLIPVTDSNTELMIDTNSIDWDLLLAAAKYAVSRLDLPAASPDDISPVPFVTDGRQAPSALTSLPSSDLRYPSLERRSNRRFGVVTLLRAFTETINILDAAVRNRYTLKGINGITGTNSTFDPIVQIKPHKSFTGSVGSATSGTVTLSMNFTNSDDLLTFLTSGGAVQVTYTYIPAGSDAADVELKTLFDSRGVLRLTADKTRIFANVMPRSLALTPVSVGLKDAPSTGRTLTTQNLAGASYSITCAITTPTQLQVTASFSGSGSLNGTITINYEMIHDTSTWTSAGTLTNVYGSPIAYAPGDKIASSAFLN